MDWHIDNIDITKKTKINLIAEIVWKNCTSNLYARHPANEGRRSRAKKLSKQKRLIFSMMSSLIKQPSIVFKVYNV